MNRCDRVGCENVATCVIAVKGKEFESCGIHKYELKTMFKGKEVEENGGN